MKSENFVQVVQQAQEEDAMAFNKVFEILSKKCKPRLRSYTQSYDDAEEVFAKTILTFWELFVVKKKPLPQENIEGYFYRMCINTWHRMQRGKTKTVLKAKPLNNTNKDYTKTEQEHYDELRQAEWRTVAFNRAVANLCEKCRRLYNVILEKGVKLKTVWQELGYINYQAIVSAKYNCKKELKRKFLVEMEDLRKMETINDLNVK